MATKLPPIRINPTTGQDVLSNPAWLPDNSGIVYRMEEDVANVGIFVRRLTGSNLGSNDKLNTPVMTSPPSIFLVAPDSRRVAFKEPRGVPNDVVRELFYSDFRSGTPVPAGTQGSATTSAIYVVEFGSGGPGSPYRVDIQPGTSTPVSATAAWRP